MISLIYPRKKHGIGKGYLIYGYLSYIPIHIPSDVGFRLGGCVRGRSIDVYLEPHFSYNSTISIKRNDLSVGEISCRLPQSAIL